MHDTLQRAWQLYRFRRYPLALEETVKFLGQHPESAEAHCLLALIHEKEKREKQALEAAKSAVSYSPDWSYPHYVLSLISYWFDEYHEALRALSEALRIQPSDPDFYELLSGIHMEQGHINTSLETADHGLEHDTEHVGCLYRRGVALFNLNRKAEAEMVFRHILTIDTEHAASQGFVGHFEMQQSRYAEALPLLRNALRENPDWELAQKAWKESLRGQYSWYGSIARLRQWMFIQYQWQVFIAVFVVVYPIVFYFSNPGGRSLMTLVSVTAFFSALITAFLLLTIYLVLTGYLNVASRILLVGDPELRRSFNWREKFKDYRNILYIFVGILLGILIMALTSKPKP